MIRLFLASLMFIFGYYHYATYYLQELETARATIFIGVQPYLKAANLNETYALLKDARDQGSFKYAHMVEYVQFDKGENSLLVDIAYQGKEKLEHTRLVISRRDESDFVYVATNAKIKDAALSEWHPYRLLFCYPIGGTCFRIPK